MAKKLKQEDVELIRALVAERDRLLSDARKLTLEAIGAKFGITKGQVHCIAAGKYWQ